MWPVRLRHCHCSAVGLLEQIEAEYLCPNCPPIAVSGLGQDQSSCLHFVLKSSLAGHCHQLVWGIPEEKTATDGLRRSCLDHLPRGWQSRCSTFSWLTTLQIRLLQHWHLQLLRARLVFVGCSAPILAQLLRIDQTKLMKALSHHCRPNTIINIFNTFQQINISKKVSGTDLSSSLPDAHPWPPLGTKLILLLLPAF